MAVTVSRNLRSIMFDQRKRHTDRETAREERLEKMKADEAEVARRRQRESTMFKGKRGFVKGQERDVP